jgi:hypothetical protein
MMTFADATPLPSLKRWQWILQACVGNIARCNEACPAALSLEDGHSTIHMLTARRELILDAESWFQDPGRRAADRGRAKILMDEMQQAAHPNRAVEIPKERRLTLICRAIEANPADKRPLRTWFTDCRCQ